MKIAVFDVDGTLLRGETICQVIARGIGTYDRMCELETLRELSEIIAAREEMAGWYLEAGKAKVEALVDGVQFAPGAVEGIKMLQKAGVIVALASVTWSFAIHRLAESLSISEVAASGLDFETGHIDHVWGDTKRDFLNQLCERYSVKPDFSAAVGDTSTDFGMLLAAGVGIFVGPEPPSDRDIVHMPDADIRDVAVAILEHRRDE